MTPTPAGATPAVPQARDVPTPTFQARVAPWLIACFGAEISGDQTERNHRFLEEALELVQACGCTRNEALQLVDYVYRRPVGEPAQEVGGVMVTLAGLCGAHGMDMHAAGDVELARIWTKVDQIRAKQAAKPRHSPLPATIDAMTDDDETSIETSEADARPWTPTPVALTLLDDIPAGDWPLPATMTPEQALARMDLTPGGDAAAHLAHSAATAPKLIGWRTDDYLQETADPVQAKNWEVHHRMLPIFEGDPNTKLGASR